MADDTQTTPPEAPQVAPPPPAAAPETPETPAPRRSGAKRQAIPAEAVDAIRAIVRDEIERFGMAITEPNPADGAMLHEFKGKIRASLIAAGHIDDQEPEAAS